MLETSGEPNPQEGYRVIESRPQAQEFPGQRLATRLYELLKNQNPEAEEEGLEEAVFILTGFWIKFMRDTPLHEPLESELHGLTVRIAQPDIEDCLDEAYMGLVREHNSRQSGKGFGEAPYGSTNL